MKTSILKYCTTFLFLFLYTSSFAESNNNIRIAVVDNLMSQKFSSEKYVQDYMQGLKTAKMVARNSKLKIEYKTFFYSTEPMSILKQIKNIKKYNPNVIIGPRSSDNFLLLKDYFENILVLSPLASSDKIKNMPKNFYSLNFSDNFSAKIIVEFIKKDLNSNNIFVISEVDCVSCSSISNDIIEEYTEIYPKKFSLKKKIISSEVGNLNIEQLMKGYNQGAIIILPGTSFASGVLVSRINNYLKQKNLIFIGGDGWGEYSVSYVGKLQTTYPYKAYRISPSFINKDSQQYKVFKKNYFKKFKTFPPKDPITYEVYLTVMSVIDALPQDINKIVTKNYILKNYKKALLSNSYYFKPNFYEVNLITPSGEKRIKYINVN